MEKQLPLCSRLNKLPVKRIERPFMIGYEHVACSLRELRQIGKTPYGADAAAQRWGLRDRIGGDSRKKYYPHSLRVNGE